jgi:hypothetical protein
VFPDVAGQGFFELLDQVYATGKATVIRGMELRLRGRDEVHFIDFVHEPIRDEGGNLTGIFVGGYEVTEVHLSAAPGGMNGRQVTDGARATRPDLMVLFVTGYAKNAVVGNGHLDAGMQVITEPFVMAALGKKIREMIEG